MAYPSGVTSFSVKATNDTIEAAHVNDLQTEITAIEGGLLTAMAHDLKFTDATYDIGKSGATRPRDIFLSRNLTAGGLLSVEGFGSHLVSAGGTGGNTVGVRNPTAGVGNFSQVSLGNDASATVGRLLALSSTYTTNAYLVQDGAVLEGLSAGGLSIAVTHALGDIRFYTQGVLRGTIDQDGAFSWVGNLSTAGVLTIQGGEAISGAGVISPTQLTANTDNYAPTGISTARVLRLSTDASRNLTGIAAQSGARYLIINGGGFDLVLVHDATSTAANRFLCPGSANFTLNTGDSVEVLYDAASSRYRVLAF